MTDGHNAYKNCLDIDSSMLEVVNVHRVIWIIVIYKYKLHQQINEQYHGKWVVIIYLPTDILSWLDICPYSQELFSTVHSQMQLLKRKFKQRSTPGM